MTLQTAKTPPDVHGLEAQRRDRFATYFPRVFAYVRSVETDDRVAREHVTDAFTQAFADKSAQSEEQFRTALFRAARRPVARARGQDDLSSREHDIISLLFDAQLTRSQVAAVLGIGDDFVTTGLMDGLKKLRSATPKRHAHAVS